VSLCDVCAGFQCKVCGHEACPFCEVACDNDECIVWGSDGVGRDGHRCEFDPCPAGCVRRPGDWRKEDGEASAAARPDVQNVLGCIERQYDAAPPEVAAFLDDGVGTPAPWQDAGVSHWNLGRKP
jgi:hypothetical protein